MSNTSPRHSLLKDSRVRAGALAAALALCVALPLSTSSSGCGKEQARPARAMAQRITAQAQLIGGPAARAEVGDYLLENDQVRVVVQDLTYNRGSGIFGGSLIDADLVRLNEDTTFQGRQGQDSFGELFPAFFLEVVDPEKIVVVNDGSDGKAAVVEVRGRGGEFVTMLRLFNQVMVNSYEVKLPDVLAGKPPSSDGEPRVEFIARYTLEPGARHVKVEGTIRNLSRAPMSFPNTTILNALAGFIGLNLQGFTVPAGHVLGFGKLNSPFLPGLGYDLRFGLEDSYQNPIDLPAFPGQLTPLVGSSSPLNVSYGFAMASSPESNFAYLKDQQQNSKGLPYYGGAATPEDMLFLFYASGFGGVFTNEIPTQLSPSFCAKDQPAEARCEALYGACKADTCTSDFDSCISRYDACLTQQESAPSEFTFTNYLLIGDGDVSSLWDELYKIRNITTRTVRGQVVEEITGEEAAVGETVLFYKVPAATTRAKGQWCDQGQSDGMDPVIFSQAFTIERGRFNLTLPEGKYCARTRAEGRPLGDMTPFEISGDDMLLQLTAKAGGWITVRATDAAGQPVPAKVSLVGVHEYAGENISPRRFLFDLQAGEPWRHTDFEPDKADDPSTRRYIERIAIIDGSGQTTFRARPGTYTAYISRGPEYEPATREITVAAGGAVTIGGAPRHVVKTPGYISGDFHMHARGSIDSGLDFNTRVTSIAAEGLELVVATDHNYVADYEPFIISGGLEPFLKSIIGLELTTFEAGHFNGFPLRYDQEYASRGSFEWQNRPPGEIFEELRQLGTLGPDKTIVQANHPRDSILGYFSQHNVDALNTDVALPFNEATGSDKILAAATAPNGPAFFTYDDATRKYTSTFSWNFDAIEVFNGKRVELNRHFRADRATLRPVYIEYYKEAYLGEQDGYDADACAEARETQAACDAGTEGDAAKCATARQDVTACAATEADATADATPKADAHLARLGDAPVIVCDGDEVAYPGHLDDWYNLLNHDRPFTLRDYEREIIRDPARLARYESEVYKKYTATGNSDSHSASFDEPGYPRNYVYVGHDDPAKITAEELVDGIQKHHLIVTNGPFINMTINGSPLGSEISASGNTVSVTLYASAASWVGADRYRLIANGEVVKTGTITLQDHEWTETFDMTVSRDTWFVLEVEGDQNMFPIVAPAEIPPFDLNTAIGSLAGPLGFGGGMEGLEPSLTFTVRPFAFTNPIWVIQDGDGVFNPTNDPQAVCQSGLLNPDPAALVQPGAARKLGSKRLDALKPPFRLKNHHKHLIGRQKGYPQDVRTVFEAWGHTHGGGQ